MIACALQASTHQLRSIIISHYNSYNDLQKLIHKWTKRAPLILNALTLSSILRCSSILSYTSDVTIVKCDMNERCRCDLQMIMFALSLFWDMDPHNNFFRQSPYNVPPQQQFPNPGGVFPNNNSMVSPRPPMLPSPQSYPQQSYPVAYAATSYSGNPSAVYAAQPQAPRRRKKACDNKRILLFTIHLLSNQTLLHYKWCLCIIRCMVTTYTKCATVHFPGASTLSWPVVTNVIVPQPSDIAILIIPATYRLL